MKRNAPFLIATLRQSPRIELLEVDFPALVADPLACLPRIRDFLGDALSGELATLAGVVKPELLHHRAQNPIEEYVVAPVK